MKLFIRNKKNKKEFLKLLILFISVFAIISCSEQKTVTVQSETDSAEECTIGSDLEFNEGNLFKLDGKIFTKNDLPTDIKTLLYENDYESYRKNLTVLKEYALRIHLAKQSNKLSDPLNPPELTELIKLPQITDQEIKTFYDQNKNRLEEGATLVQVKDQISNFLENRSFESLYKKEIAKIEADGIFSAMLATPQAPKINLDTKSYPKKGNLNAKINVIEISDYLCGHCQKAHPIATQIFSKYKDKISFTQINYSLRPNGLSGTYARGGYCALKQGTDSFWNYHEETFKQTSLPHDHSAPGHHHNENDGSAPEAQEKVISVVGKIGMDLNKFKECLNSEEAFLNVQTTNEMLRSQGINSTPVFILNNSRVAGGVKELEDAVKMDL